MKQQHTPLMDSLGDSEQMWRHCGQDLVPCFCFSVRSGETERPAFPYHCGGNSVSTQGISTTLMDGMGRIQMTPPCLDPKSKRQGLVTMGTWGSLGTHILIATACCCCPGQHSCSFPHRPFVQRPVPLLRPSS